MGVKWCASVRACWFLAYASKMYLWTKSQALFIVSHMLRWYRT